MYFTLFIVAFSDAYIQLRKKKSILTAAYVVCFLNPEVNHLLVLITNRDVKVAEFPFPTGNLYNQF